ncbi:hypothetical protein B0O80DRAFT_175860 [Mortierella sp. GBAus27b]|nr:hypothetical protein B0O80DRAFT_175860 [Mortierella sp. GBAus27b]
METTAMTKTRRVDRDHQGEEPRHRLQNESEHMARQAALVPVHRREVLDTHPVEMMNQLGLDIVHLRQLQGCQSEGRAQPESAEPSARKRQATRKGSLVPACADGLPAKAGRKLQNPARPPHRVLHIRAAATILLLPSSQDPAPDENKRAHTFTRTNDG